MRTNIDIDDELMAEAMKVTGATSKKGAVEAAFRAVIEESRARQALKNLWGIGWDGDLAQQRKEWEFDPDPIRSEK